MLDRFFQEIIQIIKLIGSKISGPVIASDKKLLAISSYNFPGLPQVCTLVSGHIDFIFDPKVSVSKNSFDHKLNSNFSSLNSMFKF